MRNGNGNGSGSGKNMSPRDRKNINNGRLRRDHSGFFPATMKFRPPGYGRYTRRISR